MIVPPWVIWLAAIPVLLLLGVTGIFMWFMGSVHSLSGIEYEDEGVGDD